MYYIFIAYFILAGCIWRFFIGTPKEIGLEVESEVVTHQIMNDNFVNAKEEKPDERIDFITALKADYVVLYGFCFFCVKFAVYAILLWMPMYLKEAYKFDN